MTKPGPRERDWLLLRLFLRSAATEATDEEVAYFREHPDEIEEIAASVNIHKLFLWAGTFLGTACVGLSKILKYSEFAAFMSEGVSEFVIDIVFETGVALIGAAVTAYILGILLNQQQENASKWRTDIRRKIKELEESE